MKTLINKGDLFRRHLELAINSLLQAALTNFLIMKNSAGFNQVIPVMGITHVLLKQNMGN